MNYKTYMFDQSKIALSRLGTLFNLQILHFTIDHFVTPNTYFTNLPLYENYEASELLQVILNLRTEYVINSILPQNLGY